MLAINVLTKTPDGTYDDDDAIGDDGCDDEYDDVDGGGGAAVDDGDGDGGHG